MPTERKHIPSAIGNMTRDNSYMKSEEEPDDADYTLKNEAFDAAYEFDSVADNNAMAMDTSTETGSQDNSIRVKQEHVNMQRISEKKASVETRVYFNYFCRKCKITMDSLLSVLQHRVEKHGIKKVRSLSIKHMDLIPDISDPDYYCKGCEKSLMSDKAYQNHLRYVHHMNVLRNLTIKNDSCPDPEDPNLYCNACEKHYQSVGSFRQHLKKIHKMRIPNLGRKTDIKHPDLLPEWDNVDFYCRTCEYTFVTIKTFHGHCKGVHKMTVPQVERPDYNDPNGHCRLCNITFATFTLYRRHCSSSHPKHKPLQQNVGPDNADPDNYRKSCDKTLSSEEAHKENLQDVHQELNQAANPLKPGPRPAASSKRIISCFVCNKTFKKNLILKRHLFHVHSQGSMELPEPNDPNLYCRVCKKTYPTTKRYRHHLRTVHWMKLERGTRARFSNTHILPDPYDPNSYCRSCQRKYASVHGYRLHCRTIHKTVYDRFVNQDAEIDISNPDFYCAKCNKYMLTIATFRQHLRVVHEMEIITNAKNTRNTTNTANTANTTNADDNNEKMEQDSANY